jgi:Short-chain dehydrogenases of various substrate specificities
MDVRMDGRVAVITGSSTGPGPGHGQGIRASGASVALLARKMDALTAAKAEVAKAAGKTNAKIEAYSCDVSKAQPIADTWKKVTGDFGKVDIVVNNAGISHAKAFDTVTDEDWQGDLDLKLFAAIRSAAPRCPACASANGAASSTCSTSAPRRRAPTRRRPASAARRVSPSPRRSPRRTPRTMSWSTPCWSA